MLILEIAMIARTAWVWNSDGVYRCLYNVLTPQPPQVLTSASLCNVQTSATCQMLKHARNSLMDIPGKNIKYANNKRQEFPFRIRRSTSKKEIYCDMNLWLSCLGIYVPLALPKFLIFTSRQPVVEGVTKKTVHNYVILSLARCTLQPSYGMPLRYLQVPLAVWWAVVGQPSLRLWW